MNVRRSAINDVIAQDKVGNEENCFKNLGNEANMRHYCTMAF